MILQRSDNIQKHFLKLEIKMFFIQCEMLLHKTLRGRFLFYLLISYFNSMITGYPKHKARTAGLTAYQDNRERSGQRLMEKHSSCLTAWETTRCVKPQHCVSHTKLTFQATVASRPPELCVIWNILNGEKDRETEKRGRMSGWCQLHYLGH